MDFIQVRTLLESAAQEQGERVMCAIKGRRWKNYIGVYIYVCVSTEKVLPKTFRRVRDDMTSSPYTGDKILSSITERQFGLL